MIVEKSTSSTSLLSKDGSQPTLTMPLTEPLPPRALDTLPILRLPQHGPFSWLSSTTAFFRSGTVAVGFARVGSVHGLAEGDFPRLLERVEPFLRAVSAAGRVGGRGAWVFED